MDQDQEENSLKYMENGVKFTASRIRQKPIIRKIMDPIHNFIHFDKLIWSIIDTPVYQRLRNIKQLGTTSYVFQGANHTRFEHCLGVGHLAQSFIRNIYKHQPELNTLTSEEKERQIQLVTIAGVVHDLGHGPFSHMFDGILIPKLTQTPWNHEQGSEQLFKYLCEEYQIDLEKHEVDLITALVHGDKNYSDGQHLWIYDIVSNHRNGIDVDKIDYIKRDSHQLGLQNSLQDFKLLMKEARVVDDEICYPLKYALNVFDIFNTRYRLYKTVYLNRVSQSIEQMLCDILLDVNQHYHFEEIIQNPSEYYKLNDTIIEQIECSRDPSFSKAQEIIKRLKLRDLYTFVGEGLLPYDMKLDEHVTIKQDILSYTQENIKFEDLYISTGNIGFGMKNDNPIDNVGFFKKQDELVRQKVDKNLTSFCMPHQFSEKFIRAFVSHKDQIQPIQLAFEKYCNKHLQCQATIQGSTFKTPNKDTANEFQKIVVSEFNISK